MDHAAIGRRSARIGASAEAAVVKVLHAHGFPDAERRRVRRHDALDIIVCPGVVASVKGGAYARTASLGAISGWHAEADAKRREHGADLALLVVQRCWVTGHIVEDRDHWEAQLGRALVYVRSRGYGEPLEPT
jgi:hypothetical protein